jgi:hypothetical protein
MLSRIGPITSWPAPCFSRLGDTTPGRIGGLILIEATVVLFMFTLAATVMNMTMLAAGTSIALVTVSALNIVDGTPARLHLLAVLAEKPAPVLMMVLLLTASLGTATELMMHIDMRLILAFL